MDEDNHGISIGYADGSALTVFWELEEEAGCVNLSVIGNIGLECRVLRLPDEMSALILQGGVGDHSAPTIH